MAVEIAFPNEIIRGMDPDSIPYVMRTIHFLRQSLCQALKSKSSQKTRSLYMMNIFLYRLLNIQINTDQLPPLQKSQS